MAHVQEHGRIHIFFSHVSTWVTKWTGSHWAVFIAELFVVVGLSSFGIEITNIAISIVTPDDGVHSRAYRIGTSLHLHLKFDEMVDRSLALATRFGVESNSEEDRELHPSASRASPRRPEEQPIAPPFRCSLPRAVPLVVRGR